jgi:hypothetical protein
MLTLLPVTLRPVKNCQRIKARHDGASERSGDRPADLFALMGPEIENGTPMIISSMSTTGRKAVNRRIQP